MLFLCFVFVEYNYMQIALSSYKTLCFWRNSIDLTLQYDEKSYWLSPTCSPKYQCKTYLFDQSSSSNRCWKNVEIIRWRAVALVMNLWENNLACDW